MSEHIERVAVVNGRGQSWSETEEDELRSLMQESGSLTWSAHRLQRTPTAVATRMSMLGLRTAAMSRRQPWTERDDAALRTALAAHTRDGVIQIKLVAAAVERSVDATLARLTAAFGLDPELLDRLSFDDPENAAIGPNAGDTRAMRRCLGPGCGRPFLSHGAGNRVCGGCKKSPAWS